MSGSLRPCWNQKIPSPLVAVSTRVTPPCADRPPRVLPKPSPYPASCSEPPVGLQPACMPNYPQIFPRVRGDFCRGSFPPGLRRRRRRVLVPALILMLPETSRPLVRKKKGVASCCTAIAAW